LRCGKCGNENEAANRFCGMCGAALVANDRAGGQAPVAEQTGAGAAAVEERRPAAVSAPDARADAWPKSRPVISGGPSLLGLNVSGSEADSGQARGGRDSLRASSNVDYLLEDEEEPGRNWGKLILVVGALVLAAGFGYLHWKQGGFDWLNGGDKKPAVATTQAPDGAPGGDSAAGTAPVTGTPASPVEAGAPQTGVAQTSSQVTPMQSAPTETAATPGADPNSALSSTAPPTTAPPSAAQSDAGDSGAPAAAPQAANSDSEKQSAPAEANPRQRAHKPSAAKPVAEKPVDSVSEAERYIYGRGVGQDCDRGLRLLKPAAGQSNVKAMISLGALYSTGTCTPRDLPTAYRWFAMALHKQPDNQVLQDDLQKLWSRMTQPERQLAIRLSQ
jgi:hypothetical protein